MTNRDRSADGQADEEHTPLFAQSRYERIIDKRIAEAMAAGLFDNLPGAGKPLELEDDTNVPEEDRAGYRLLKNSGYSLPWIELRRVVEEEQEQLALWLRRANEVWRRRTAPEREQLRAEYQQKIADINQLIIRYNLTVPPVVGQLALLQPWRELRKLGQET